MTRARRADLNDAQVAASILVASRRAFEDVIPPLVHSAEAVADWLRSCIAGGQELWLVEIATEPVGMMLLGEDTVEQLYVQPSRTGQGIGAVLLQQAKSKRDQLELWTFQSNQRARAFYARHGFAEVRYTDGDNEEGAPDVLMRWQRSSVRGADHS